MDSRGAASGTQVFFSDFFPSAFHCLSTNWPTLWRLLQPTWLASECPEHEVTVQLPLAGGAWAWVQLRNPTLLPFQLAGLAVALLCMRLVASQTRFAYLWHSLLFFAAMNASSILCHALAVRGTLLWQAALRADIAFTGSSSLCLLCTLVLAAPATTGVAARRCWAILLLLLAIVAGDSKAQLPWVPEALYLGTTALACAACGHRLLRSWLALPCGRRSRVLPRLALAVLGLSSMLLCLPLDPLLCWAAGPWLGTVHLLFGGSALSFAALVLLRDMLSWRPGASVRSAPSAKAD